MAQHGSRSVVERYADAVFHGKIEVLPTTCHADYVEEWPQSGERIRGVDNVVKIHQNYPRFDEIVGQRARVIGAEDRWVATPAWTLLRIVGSGDAYTLTGTGRYPDGKFYHIVSIVELRDGLIAKGITYWAEPFDAPAWRSQWVERIQSS